MLEVNNIEVVYNDVILVLKGISLQVPPNGIVALLGANGAGKTTTLKAISGILTLQAGRLEGGSISFKQKFIHDLDPDAIVRTGICMVPEGRRIFDELTVIENLMIGSYTRTNREQTKADLDSVFHYFPVLEERAHQRSVYLSGGEQQMLAVGRAFMSSPELIMLDEPSLGTGAPVGAKHIQDSEGASIGNGTPPFFWWNKTQNWRSDSPRTAISWKTEKWFWTDRAKCLWRTRM